MPDQANRFPLIVISGPTGVGKSETATAVALDVGGEVVNYDSIQIYKGFDIGSAKPSAAQRLAVPHHLFDIAEADEPFHAAAFAETARSACAGIQAEGHIPVLTGGTGFYLRALLAGLPETPPADAGIRQRLRAITGSPGGSERLHRWLMRIDPGSGRKIAPADRHRVERALEVYLVSGLPISSWRAPTALTDESIRARKFALSLDRERLVERIESRVDAMFEGGLIEETDRLLVKYPPHCRPFGAIGYREASRFLAGEISREQAVAETKRRTRAYAKRQMTWLRSERGIHWVDAGMGPLPAAREISRLWREHCHSEG
ncbi:MAG TPA: tRNA (adenosine(37)-N6)-dimethylallyltransferase MiaA [Thermoanaerobaculia bacterium]|nr:tRNA (adenosine(37)-N6)-dimethylallyltransferase MiaA [Thermoanaerobaculia bacterium]